MTFLESDIARCQLDALTPHWNRNWKTISKLIEIDTAKYRSRYIKWRQLEAEEARNVIFTQFWLGITILTILLAAIKNWGSTCYLCTQWSCTHSHTALALNAKPTPLFSCTGEKSNQHCTLCIYNVQSTSYFQGDSLHIKNGEIMAKIVPHLNFNATWIFSCSRGYEVGRWWQLIQWYIDGFRSQKQMCS